VNSPANRARSQEQAAHEAEKIGASLVGPQLLIVHFDIHEIGYDWSPS